MTEERDREEWTDEDERHPEGEPGPMQLQDEGIAMNLEAQDDVDMDVDPAIAEEVELQEETRELEGDEGEVETVLNFRDEEDEED
jgi:hypothetical protein